MNRLSGRARRREQHKQDLRLASALARQQMAVALNDIQDHADLFGARLGQARALFARPSVRVGGGLAALLLGSPLRRSRPARLLAWLLWGWRAWRAVAPLLRPPSESQSSELSPPA